ncbi:hypothetical protein ACP2W5_28120, partial [Bacillus paranthracis]|uniref:hypothetical protein n=1 Tax=Bacillus paranthracis TaxID=2026186 RepID=UPI001C4B9FE2
KSKLFRKQNPPLSGGFLFGNSLKNNLFILMISITKICHNEPVKENAPSTLIRRWKGYRSYTGRCSVSVEIPPNCSIQ